MNKKRLKWAGVFAAIVLALYGYIIWPAFVTPTASGGPISGQVIEDGSTKPIAGAIVVALWRGTAAYSSSVCFHVASAITDGEGRYHIPAWKKKHKFGNVGIQRVNIYPHKIGYQRTETHFKNDLRSLALDTGTREQRLKYLKSVSPDCYSEDESENNLLPILRAVYGEAQSIATTKEDMKTLEFILYDLEIIEMGYEAAEKKHLKRARALN